MRSDMSSECRLCLVVAVESSVILLVMTMMMLRADVHHRRSGSRLSGPGRKNRPPFGHPPRQRRSPLRVQLLEELRQGFPHPASVGPLCWPADCNRKSQGGCLVFGLNQSGGCRKFSASCSLLFCLNAAAGRGNERVTVDSESHPHPNLHRLNCVTQTCQPEFLFHRLRNDLLCIGTDSLSTVACVVFN